MTRIPKPRIPELKFPPRPDWCFSNVPEDEVPPCVFWEYARESKLKILGPQVNLREYPELTQVNRRLINALLTTDALEVEERDEDFGTPKLEGFFQEIAAWQDLSEKARGRFRTMFEDAFVWTTDDYDLARNLIDTAEAGDDKTADSKALTILLSDESLRACSNSVIRDIIDKKISEFREGARFRADGVSSNQASPLPGLFGDGITSKKRRAFLTQLGAFRLMKDNSPSDLISVFSGSDKLDGLVHHDGGQNTWHDLPTWSKAKKRVPEIVAKWFPLD